VRARASFLAAPTAEDGMHDDAVVERAMARAIALGAAARRHTPPWPWVGCVVVRDGDVVGEGATGPFRTGDHAEVAALRSAGAAARGATAVVTLEPCDHHGNTPPCTGALLDAGVGRVVVACDDPDDRVAGRGIARLRDAGVTVDVGIGVDAAAASLAPYLHHRRTGRPLTILKTATSLDARIAAADGTSRWITGAAARRDVHRLRAESQAIVVGAGTALADDPTLTVRDAPAGGARPWRVLVDGTGRVPATGPLFDADLGPTLVCTSDRAPRDVRAAWERSGARVEVLGGREPVDPGAVLDLLGALGVLQVLLEGGAALHARFLEAGVVDQIVTYVAPTLLGGSALAGYGVGGPPTIDDAPRMALRDVVRLGDDVRLTYDLGGRLGDDVGTSALVSGAA
jgi:diaminohydroxyphosphoribosylaminopyrimidine deaminase / 5-amino-6-(5-phosphoribosylamino)uracil reductase